MQKKKPDATIHAEAVAPYAFRYTVTSGGAAPFDLSTVSAAAFDVRRESSKKKETWTATLENQTSVSIDLVHVFVVGDVPEEDFISVQPRLTTPGGILIAKTKILEVLPPFS